MRKNIQRYHENFLNLISSIKVVDGHKRKLNFYHSIEIACNIIKKQSSRGGGLFFIGNGGSAAIASHMAVDFWKSGAISAMAFTDSSLLTCISNDFGYENVFAKPIEFFADKKDILFAISSSGESKNILKAIETMSRKGGNIITLSGFKENNPLTTKGICNFYVPSHEYGLVEVIHQYICHFILDTIISNKTIKRIQPNE